MNQRLLVILTICFIIAGTTTGCINATSTNSEEQYIDENLTTVIQISCSKDILRVDSIVRDYKLTQLEASDESLIGEVSKLSFHNDKYYILDRHQRKALFVFDEDGRFSHFIGLRGRGPGEYLEPTDFVVSNSTVTVFDMFSRKLLYYNLDGSFIKSTSLNYIIYEIESSQDGSAMYAVSGTNPQCDSLKNFELFEIAPNSDILFKAYENKHTMNFSKDYDLQRFNNNIIYKKALRSAVYQLSNKRVYAKYLFDIPADPLPKDYEARCKGDFEQFITKYRDNYTYFNGQFWETERYVGVGITSKQLPNLIIYDKQTTQTTSGMIGITFGTDEIDTNGLFILAMNSTLDVCGNRIIGVIKETLLSPRMRDTLFNNDISKTISNPVIITIELNHCSEI